MDAPPPAPGTSDLTAALRAGDPAAEEAFVAGLRPRLVSLLRWRLGSHEAAEELANDALLAGLSALREGRLREDERLVAFVYGAARNLAANYRRRQASRPLTLPLAEAPLPAVPPVDFARRERLTLARRALRELGPVDRQVVELTLAQSSAEEIGHGLGLSPEAVRMRRSRALRRLATRVQELLRWPAAQPPRG